MATGFIWDERFAWFYRGLVGRGPFFSPLGAFDSSESKERIRELLVASGLADQLVSLPPRLMTEEELLRHQTPEYVSKVKALSDGEGGDAGENAYLGRNCYDIARLAAGGALVALESVLDGRVDNVYALLRPCGHHATRDFGRGFCIFCNIPLAILNAKAHGKVERVAVVDWDVHHGNGTQDAFYSDPSVLTISIHQDGYYPMDSGGLEERGDGPGRGCNLNVPLPPGSGHGAYVETMKRVVVPALRRFRPEVIVVASGLDANAYDPLARMMCHTETFREMATLLLAVAEELCDGRLVACHEGGYAPYYVPWCALAVVETFAGIRTPCKDPSLGYLVGRPGQELQPHQADVIRDAAALVNDIRR